MRKAELLRIRQHKQRRRRTPTGVRNINNTQRIIQPKHTSLKAELAIGGVQRVERRPQRGVSCIAHQNQIGPGPTRIARLHVNEHRAAPGDPNGGFGYVEVVVLVL